MLLLRSLQHRSFALLWSGQLLSRLGDSLYKIALVWWVVDKTGSAATMGTLLVVSFTPMLLFLLLGGVAVDRYPRVWVMVLSDLLRGLLVGLIAILAFANLLEVWHLYIASFIFGFVDAFFTPAYTAIIPEVTPSNALSSANALTSLSKQIATIVGPGIGALIVSLGGTPTAFLLNSLSFFLSAGCLAPLLVIASHLKISAGSENVFHELGAAFDLVRKVPWLWITICLAAFANITLFGPIDVSLPFLLKSLGGVNMLGWAYSTSALGSFVGTIWFSSIAHPRKRGLLGYSMWILLGVATMTYALFPSLPGITLAAFTFGFALLVFSLIWTKTLQEIVPLEMLGRVSSIDSLGSYALLPVGYAVGGWLTDSLGPVLVLVGGGAITLGLVALALCFSAIRNLD